MTSAPFSASLWRILPASICLTLVGCGPSPLPPKTDGPRAGVSLPSPPNSEGLPPADHAPILVDSIHAHNYLTKGLTPGNYNYHEIYAIRRGLDFLAAEGFPYEEATSGLLDAERLAGRKVLFLNLVSADRPPFRVSEIQAIRDFVSRGGGLFVVTDHSNCYFHAHILEPLFAELGLRTYTDTACDVPPHTLGVGNGWIAVTRFEAHPVTAGLRCMTQQSGGRVDRDSAVALTSDEAWADRWIIGAYGDGDFPGYYGDWKLGPDEELGPFGIVAAKQLGRGRIVVIGDQNMIGDVFLNYADNYRLWLNALAWLLREPRLADPKKYESSRSPRVLLYDDYEHSSFAAGHLPGYHHALALLSRHYWTFTSNRLEDLQPAALIIFALDDVELPPTAAAVVAKHLQAGRNVLVLDNAAEEPLAGALVAAIARELPEASRPRVAESTDLATTLTIPGGGSIRLLNSPARFDNYNLENPTLAPTPEQRARAEELLREVKTSLAPP